MQWRSFIFYPSTIFGIVMNNIEQGVRERIKIKYLLRYRTVPYGQIFIVLFFFSYGTGTVPVSTILFLLPKYAYVRTYMLGTLLVSKEFPLIFFIFFT